MLTKYKLCRKAGSELDKSRRKNGKMAALATEIDFYPHTIAAAYLGISERQLRDVRRVLRKKFKGEFRDKPNSKGLNPEDFRFLATYRQLAKQRGQKAAIDHIRVYGV